MTRLSNDDTVPQPASASAATAKRYVIRIFLPRSPSPLSMIACKEKIHGAGISARYYLHIENEHRIDSYPTTVSTRDSAHAAVCTKPCQIAFW
jgi:hypothetical protein